MSNNNGEMLDALRHLKRFIKDHPSMPGHLTAEVGPNDRLEVCVFLSPYHQGEEIEAVEAVIAEVGEKGWDIGKTTVSKLTEDGVRVYVYIPSERSIDFSGLLLSLGWIAATESVV